MKSSEFLLRLSREAIEAFAKTKKAIPIPEKYPKELKEKRGVFVSLHKKTEGYKELRGCIGFPTAEKPLIEGIIDASVSASRDPRFPSLKEEELKDVFIEISILSEPKLIEVKSSKEYLNKIKIGKDGLIISRSPFAGLLLPQVPLEFDPPWTVEDFLNNLCIKAALPIESWKYPSVRIYKFQAEVIKEK